MQERIIFLKNNFKFLSQEIINVLLLVILQIFVTHLYQNQRSSKTLEKQREGRHFSTRPVATAHKWLLVYDLRGNPIATLRVFY